MKSKHASNGVDNRETVDLAVAVLKQQGCLLAWILLCRFCCTDVAIAVCISTLRPCRLLALPGPHYVLFLADDDPATGVSWCPDCVRCGPAVKRVCADKNASLLEVLVGQRPVWKDPEHPLR